MFLCGCQEQGRLRVERPVVVVPRAVVFPGQRQRETPLGKLFAHPGVEVARVFVEVRIGIDGGDVALMEPVTLVVVVARPAEDAP